MLSLLRMRHPSGYWKPHRTCALLNAQANTHNSWPLCPGGSYLSRTRFKMSCSNTWQTKCLSVRYRSKKQPSPEPARPPAPGSTASLRHQWKRFIPSALLPVSSGLMRDGARCPRGALPSAPAPYRHVACFPASASNGRSRFPSSRLPRSILPQVEDGPWGRGKCKRSLQTAAQWSICSK